MAAARSGASRVMGPWSAFRCGSASWSRGRKLLLAVLLAHATLLAVSSPVQADSYPLQAVFRAWPSHIRDGYHSGFEASTSLDASRQAVDWWDAFFTTVEVCSAVTVTTEPPPPQGWGWYRYSYQTNGSPHTCGVTYGYVLRTAVCPYGGRWIGNECRDAPPCGRGQVRDPATGRCLTKQPRRSCMGNPIEPALANKFQDETDYRGSGEFPLAFVRTYNSVSVPQSRLGLQWRHSYDRAVQPVPGVTPTAADVFRPDGAVLRFTQQGADWVSDADVTDRLVRLTNASGTPTGWEFTSAADDSV